MTPKNPNSKNDILEAALRVVLRDGFWGFTLEKIAAEANLSKGGILHHFPSKDALLAAFVTSFSQRIPTMIEKKMHQLPPDEPGRFIKTMFSVAFPAFDAGAETEEATVVRSHRDFMASLMTAGLFNPELIRPLRDLRTKMCHDLLESSETGEEEVILWMAFEGLSLWQLSGLAVDGDAHGKRLAELLYKRAQQIGAGSKGRKRKA